MVKIVRAIAILGLATGLYLLRSIVLAYYSELRRHEPPPDFGVGLYLSLDYGTASIWYGNGSAVDVAKIEGSPRYKQAMRLLEPEGTTSTPETSHRAPQPWLGDHFSAGAIEDMMIALRTATSSYLSTHVPVAGIAIPISISEASREKLNLAAKAISLDCSRQVAAGRLTARVNGIYGNCSYIPGAVDDPPQVFLNVDYSRAALTLTLLVEECGIYEEFRAFHNTNLGKTAMSECSEVQGEELCQKMLVDALYSFVEMPIQYDNALLKEIGVLVLVGESAFDSRLDSALRQVLGGQYEILLAKEPSEEGFQRVAPVFAASSVIAQSSYYSQQDY